MRSNGYLLPILTLIVSALIVTSCKESSYEIPTIDFKNFDNKIDLSLSDLISDMRIVPLETREDLLLSNRANIAVSDKHIVISSQTEIHQFDRDGKHVRVLAVQGKGPDEFNQIGGFIIDDKNDILYYRDHQSKMVSKRVSLKTGEHFIPLDFGEAEFYAEVMDPKGRLYGFNESINHFRLGGNEEISEKSLFFSIYDPKTGEKEDIHTLYPFIPGNASKGINSLGDEVTIFNLNYSDTLYNYNNGELKNRAIFNLENKASDLFIGREGVDLLFMTPDGIILSRSVIKFQQYDDPEGRVRLMMGILNEEKVYLDKKGGVSLIKSIYLDPFGYRVDLAKDSEKQESNANKIAVSTPRYCDGYGFYLLDPIVYMQLLEHAIESGDVSDKLKREYRENLNNIDEESNPVIIIGKIR